MAVDAITRWIPAGPKRHAWVYALIGMARGPLLCSSLDGAEPPPAPVNFEVAIRPLLKEHCHKCHGPDLQEAGLRLDLKAEALAGGNSGPAILPGHPQDSLLIELVRGNDPDKVMPPQGETLSPQQIARLERWIAEGAVWPDDGTANATEATNASPKGMRRRRSDGRSGTMPP